MDRFKEGSLCKTCGNTTRYKKGSACVKCARKRSLLKAKANIKGVWIHRLSNINKDNKEAICAACGPVRIRLKRTTWRCIEGINAQRGSYSYKPRVRRSGVCDICKKEKPLCYDHDHKTEKHRGWLCHHCNVGIGFLQDDITILKTAIEYLSKSIAN